ncbi:MAG: hypothetical protein OES13_05665 [Acidimicrobiia bacterium]|nr:hypothetical protein [Acidimicrobiia bacterium]
MRWPALVLVLAVVAVSCGEDDDGADPARFCDIDTEIEQLDDFSSVSPDEARDIISEFRELLAEAERVAPGEISSAVQVTGDSVRQILDFYAAADFDVGPAEFEAAIESGEIPVDPPEAEIVFDWLDENCAS